MTSPQFPAPGSTDIALSVRTHDRVGERRTDEEWLDETWTDPETRIVPVAGTTFPVDDAGGAVRWQASDGLPEDGLRIFLGTRDGVAHFALVVDEPTDEARWTGFRGVVATLPEPDAGFMVHAVALAEWHASHRFCPRCGSRLVSSAAGHVLRCEENNHQHFPRTDPAVIMMVTDGDRALLGRQAAWPEGRFSTLAGFVDPGESLEEAVVREVAEESGVEVGEPRYIASQPWPFPSSLMLGFEVPWLAGEPRALEDEIQDVRWFSREEIAAAAADDLDGWGGEPDPATPDATSLLLPPRLAIARRLLERWLAG